MTTLDSSISGRPAFRITRKVVTSQGFGTELDPRLLDQLDSLAALLGKRVFAQAAEDSVDDGGHYCVVAVDPAEVPVQARGAGGQRKSRARAKRQLLRLNAMLLPLTPQRVPKEGDSTGWEDGSLADVLYRADSLKRGATLSERVELEPTLFKMKYALLNDLDDELAGMSPAVRAVMDRGPLVDYMVVLASKSLGIDDADSLRQFIFRSSNGLSHLVRVATVGAARALVHDEQLKVTAPNDDDGGFVQRLLNAAPPLGAQAFAPAVKEVIRAFMLDRDEERLIKLAKLPPLSAAQRAALVRAIQRSKLQIDESNASQILAAMLMDIVGSGGDGDEGIDAQRDEDFEVQFADDSGDDASAQISRSAVLCAAQLYHSMVLGDELDVFGAVHYLIFQRPHVHGGMRVNDARLRSDLQLYALDNAFIDLKRGRSGRDGRPPTCTRPAERQMFARQVFDEGPGRLPDDYPANGEFRQLWKVLMLESARYLERAQASLHPESFVSPQNVMQAVEDLQYNLSSNCTGMATVISPRVDAELAFVMERILKHPDVINHVVPEGGTWKQVVDRLNAERRQMPGKASTLYNKADVGKRILERIADYTPDKFQRDEVFSEFISLVDAFITTQSILLRPHLSALDDGRDEERGQTGEVRGVPSLQAPEYGRSGTPAEAAPAGAPDEWDF